MKMTLLLAVLVSSIGIAEVRRMDPPAAPDSGMPNLTVAPDGTVYISWTDTLGPKEHALRLSRWTTSGWTAAETIVQGRNWFANWADFPALTVLPDRSMLAHWLTRTDGGGTYGYGIRVTRRSPDDLQWREIHGMSLGLPTDYAGFLSFVPGEANALYLSPPTERPDSTKAGHDSHHSPDADGHGAAHRKTVRQISFDGQGKVRFEAEVDADACSCCQTAIGRTKLGMIAAYRDHQPGEIRDIAIIRQVHGVWSKPKILHADGWKINGCPSDGPSLAAADSQVAVAWLTRAGGIAKVQVSASRDSGETFSQPLRLDAGNPLGRPAITPAGDGSFVAAWIEKIDAEQNELRIRRVHADGSVGEPFIIAKVPVGRYAGFPKVAISGKQILVAWRDKAVRAAVLSQNQLNRTK